MRDKMLRRVSYPSDFTDKTEKVLLLLLFTFVQITPWFIEIDFTCLGLHWRQTADSFFRRIMEELGNLRDRQRHGTYTIDSCHPGADTGFMKGGGHNILNAAGGSALRRVAPISPREARKNFFVFIFHFSGWALVAPSRFALHVPDVRGLQVPGPP